MRITIGAIGTKPIIAAGDQYPTVDKPIANLELDFRANKWTLASAYA